MNHSTVHDQSMLGRVFDQYQNMMQVARCVREAARQRGLSRPRLLELSRRETGLADFVPELEVVRYPTHHNNQPTLSRPVRIPFPDSAFDACLVTDAYEHIEPAQRPELLAEMVRVTHGVVLLACPMETEVVTRFDKVVFDFIWGKYAERFEPLDQHVEFGLEPLEQVMASLVDSGATRAIALPDNYVYRWIHQILIYFDLQHRHPQADVFSSLNAIYNERLANADYHEPCYRYLIVGATAPGLDLDEFERSLQGRPATPAAVAAAEGHLIEEWHAIEGRLADRLRVSAAEQDQLQAQLRECRLVYAAMDAVRTGAQSQLSAAQAEVARLTVALSNARIEQERLAVALSQAQAEQGRLAATHAAYVNSRSGRLVQFLWRIRRTVWPWGHAPNA